MLITTLAEICFGRANPQDLPSSRHALSAALFVYAFVGVLGVVDLLPLERAVLASLADTLMLLGVTHGVLRWRNLKHRFTQTLTALAGCGALLSLLAWTLTGLVPDTIRPEWGWLPMLAWYRMVFGHIVRHALSIPLVVGAAASLVYLIFSIGVASLFINPTPLSN